MNLSFGNRALFVLVLSFTGIGMHAEEKNPMAIVKANFQAADRDGNGALDSREFPALIDANAEHKMVVLPWSSDLVHMTGLSAQQTGMLMVSLPGQNL